MKAFCDFICPALRVVVISLGTILFGIFGTLTAAAQSSAPQRPKSIYDVLKEAPEKATERKNPFAGNTEAVAAGGKLFEQHCAECHGTTAGGSMHGANLRRPEVQQASPGTLFWILTNGVVRQGMPVWSKLPEPERWQIVTFLQSLRQSQKPAVDGLGR